MKGELVMINNVMRNSSALLILVGLSVPSASGVPITAATVGVQAPGPTAGMVINDATSNTGPNGLTLATFQTLIPTAFAAQTGGVLNAEDQSAGGTIPGMWRNNNTNYGDGAANQVTLTFGSSQANSIGLYRRDLDPVTSLPVAINGNTNNAFWVSSNSYLGVQGPGSPVDLTFAKGLSVVGLTLVPRGALRNVTIPAITDNAGTLAGSTQTITADHTSGAFF
jgi:hypothetical protein